MTPPTETIPCRIRHRGKQRMLIPQRQVPELRLGDTIHEERNSGRVVLVIHRASTWRRFLIRLHLAKAPENPNVRRFS